MKQILGEELKQIQLEILDVVVEFCKKNKITYWLDSGTLLGAIRHKGYIPWDDDIDIGMLREDYKKFAQKFNLENDRYKFICIENTPDFFGAYGKVCDTETVLYEPDEDGYKLSVNIDIFIYDNAPDDDKKVKAMYDRRDSLRAMYILRTSREVVSSNPLKKIIKKVVKCFLIAFNKNNQIQLMAKNAQKYAGEQTRRLGNFTAYTRMTCDRSAFDEFIEVEFEGKMYNAPIGYDKWLRSFYGDYMKLPPVEKRISHHSFIAYKQD